MPADRQPDRLIFRPDGRPAADVLVAIFLRGGIDGVYAVPPIGDPAYGRQRHSLDRASRQQSGNVVDLDGFFGLHPDFSLLAPFFAAGTLAVVHACGLAEPILSHFEATASLERGTHTGGTQDGWIGRHLISSAGPETTGVPLRAVAMGTVVPPVLRGLAGARAIRSLEALKLELPAGWTPNFTRALRHLYQSGADPISVSGRDTLALLDHLSRLDRSPRRTANVEHYQPDEFGQQLQEVSRLISADAGLEVAVLSLGGWDSHASQVPELVRPMQSLANNLRAFLLDMEAGNHRVVVAVMSEFGRRVAPNGADGTDHGRATTMLVAGSGIRGGKVYAKWPGLAPDELDADGNLPVTIDYRDVLAELVSRRLGNPEVGRVFPDFSPNFLDLTI